MDIFDVKLVKRQYCTENYSNDMNFYTSLSKDVRISNLVRDSRWLEFRFRNKLIKITHNSILTFAKTVIEAENQLRKLSEVIDIEFGKTSITMESYTGKLTRCVPRVIIAMVLERQNPFLTVSYDKSIDKVVRVFSVDNSFSMSIKGRSVLINSKRDDVGDILSRITWNVIERESHVFINEMFNKKVKKMVVIKIPFLINEEGDVDHEDLVKRLEEEKRSGRSYLSDINVNDISFVPVGDGVSRKWIKLLRNELDINFKLVIVYLHAHCNNIRIFPEMEDIFNVFKMPVKDIRVVIVGQDPYPGEDKDGKPNAIGYSFATRSKTCPASLRNMLNLVGASQHFTKKDFTLEGWVNQGVFLYNTCLFFYADNTDGPLAKQHKMWDSFNTRIFEYIKENNPKAKYLLLGADAQKLLKFGHLQEKDCVVAPHPSSRNVNADFRDSDCFNSMNRLLKNDIDWSKC